MGERPEVDHRFTLANERTFLAWLRTALALAVLGAVVVVLLAVSGCRVTTGGGTLSAERRRARVRPGGVGAGRGAGGGGARTAAGACTAVLGLLAAVALLTG